MSTKQKLTTPPCDAEAAMAVEIFRYTTFQNAGGFIGPQLGALATEMTSVETSLYGTGVMYGIWAAVLLGFTAVEGGDAARCLQWIRRSESSGYEQVAPTADVSSVSQDDSRQTDSLYTSGAV